MDMTVLVSVLVAVFIALWAAYAHLDGRAREARQVRTESQEARSHAQTLTVTLIARSARAWMQDVINLPDQVEITQELEVRVRSGQPPPVRDFVSRLGDHAAVYAELFAMDYSIRATCERIIQLDRCLRIMAIWQAVVIFAAIIAVVVTAGTSSTMTLIGYCALGECLLAVVVGAGLCMKRDRLADSFGDECDDMKEFAL